MMVYVRSRISSWIGKYSFPEILSIILLVIQLVLPWTGRFFLTQDGPSHLYNALATKALLLHPEGPFGKSYEFQHQVTTNWSMTALFSLFAFIFSPSHAEQAMATACIFFGFAAFSYFIRSLDCTTSGVSPVVNFLLNTWFLWMGFYNFYIGIALFAYLTAYYIRNLARLDWRRTIVLSAGALITFFTHVLPYAILIISVILISVWMHVVVPITFAEPRRSISATLRSAVRLWAVPLVALLPSLLLFGVYLQGALTGTTLVSNYEWAFNAFPMHLFASARGKVGEQAFLVPVILFYCAIGVLSMKKRQWTTARGAVSIMAFVSFLLYLFIPDAGFGGSLIKIRMLWPMFICGAAIASSLPGLRRIQTPLGIYITCYMVFTLSQAGKQNVYDVSRVAEACKPIFDLIPPGANVVRLGYPTELTRTFFNMDAIAVDPILHIEAWGAAQGGWVDLSDYQALTHIFPLREHRSLSNFRYPLWGLEGVTASGAPGLREILNSFPLKIHYILVIGDGRAEDRSEILKELRSRMHLVATDSSNAFIWLFKNSESRQTTDPK